MDNKRALSMIGLAQKAGKVASGEFSTEKAVKEHKVTEQNNKYRR